MTILRLHTGMCTTGSTVLIVLAVLLGSSAFGRKPGQIGSSGPWGRYR